MWGRRDLDSARNCWGYSQSESVLRQSLRVRTNRGPSIISPAESHWLFPLQLGAAAAWDQQGQEGDLISYVWGSFESLETWTRLYKCKALLQEGFLWWSRTRKVNYWERLSGVLEPSGDFHPCRRAPILVPAFSTIPLHAVINLCARLLSVMVFL